jgi:addiction module RelE/StbE family toxin
MAAEIIWKPEAQDDFREIVDYLLDNWPDEVAEKFTNEIDYAQDLIAKHPNIGMKAGRLRSVRKITVPPFYSIYYTSLNNQIWILNLLDNRQKPEQL